MSKNGGKLEWHHSNIYRDFLDFLLTFLLKPFVTSSFFKENEKKKEKASLTRLNGRPFK